MSIEAHAGGKWSPLDDLRVKAEPADEIVWGEWVDHITGDQLIGDWQSQSVGGVQQFRFPVKREPVVETATVFGQFQKGWGCDAWYFNLKRTPDDAHAITFDVIDGKPDWSTLRGEDL